MSIHYKKIIYYFGVFILIVNLPPISTPLRTILDNKHYKYSNGDGSYTFQEDFWKAKITINTSMNKVHPDFIKSYPETSDTIIYRLYARNPLCFWRWSDYLFNKRYYTFQYRNWDNIEEIRKKKEASGIIFSKHWINF